MCLDFKAYIADNVDMDIAALHTTAEAEEVRYPHLPAVVAGSDPGWQAAVELIERRARMQRSTLIEGQTGSGKELLAAYYHRAWCVRQKDKRWRLPFVIRNCADWIDPDKALADLFGYSEGAFTGAAPEGRPGAFRLANNGTLFLDEADMMHPRVQGQLLRAMATGMITPMGSNTPKKVNVRVLMASHADLSEVLRDDLYYRFTSRAATVTAPPMSSRCIEDRRRFVELCIAEDNQDRVEIGEEPFTISPEAVNALAASECGRGGIRQLQSAVSAAEDNAWYDGHITLEHVPGANTTPLQQLEALGEFTSREAAPIVGCEYTTKKGKRATRRALEALGAESAGSGPKSYWRFP